MISSIPSVTPAPASTGSVAAPVKQQTDSAQAAVDSTVVNLSQPGSSFKTVLDYAPADENQDGQVGELERRAYDLEHPTITPREKVQAEPIRSPGLEALQAYQNVSGND